MAETTTMETDLAYLQEENARLRDENDRLRNELTIMTLTMETATKAMSQWMAALPAMVRQLFEHETVDDAFAVFVHFVVLSLSKEG